MVLVDTSIWIDHLRRGDSRLVELLERGMVVTHPFVVGELACGSLGNRGEVLGLLRNLAEVTVGETDEVHTLLERHALHGKGLGWVDMHLLASATLERVGLWTRDKRLLAAAASLGVAYVTSH